MQVISGPPTRASDMGFVSFTERLKVDKEHSISFIDDSVLSMAAIIPGRHIEWSPTVKGKARNG